MGPTSPSLLDLLAEERRSWKSEEFRLMKNERLWPDLDWMRQKEEQEYGPLDISWEEFVRS